MDTSRVHFPNPTGLLSDIPAALGYFPSRRLMVLLIHAEFDESADGSPLVLGEWTIRGYPVDTDPETALSHLQSSAVQIGATLAVAVVADDRLTGSAGSSGDIGQRLLTSWAERLTEIGVPLACAWAVPEFTTGARWWTVIGPQQRGVLTDCTLTPAALDRVVAGQPLHRTLEAISHDLAPDPHLAQLVEALLPAAHTRAEHLRRRATVHQQLDQYHRDLLEMVLRRIADTDAGETLTPATVAEVAVALSDPVVLTCLFATTLSAYPVAAQRMWVLLLSGLTGRERAPAAVLSAYAAYHCGDGTHAAHSVHVALTADRANTLARLLHAALEAGLPPRRISRLAQQGLVTATGLGIELC